MSETLHCVRCQRDAAALDAAPAPGELGAEILRRVCRDCWDEWRRMEIMVINELRLNFMDPKAQQVLDHHLREFLVLDGGGSGPNVDS